MVWVACYLMNLQELPQHLPRQAQASHFPQKTILGCTHCVNCIRFLRLPLHNGYQLGVLKQQKSTLSQF